MAIDAYAVDGTRTDLLGFVGALGLGLWMITRSLRNNRLLAAPLFATATLIIYLSAVFLLTDANGQLVSFLASRYGILTWFVLGLSAASMLDILRDLRDASFRRYVRLELLASLALIGVLALNFAMDYLSLPIPTISYQSVASNAIILLLLSVCAMHAVWGPAKPILVSMGFLIVGTALVSAVAMMQSTLIVAFWGVMFLMCALEILSASAWHKKVVFGISMFALLYLFSNSESFSNIIEATRFAELLYGSGELSPISTRRDIAATFAQQFAVSPLFGHFNAEMVSGAGVGNYVHSLPLSLLTHTGIVGFALFLIVICLALRHRAFARGLDPAETQYLRYMVLLILLGSLATFLTWSVLWFMLGLLCKRPKIA